MALNSRDWVLSVRTEDCFSSVLVATERGAFSITTASRNQSSRIHPSVSCKNSLSFNLQQFEKRKCYRGYSTRQQLNRHRRYAGPRYEIVSSEGGAPQQVEVGALHKVEARASQKVEAGAPQNVEAGPPQKVEARAPQKVEAGAPQNVEAGAPQKFEAGAPQKVEAAPMKTVDGQKGLPEMQVNAAPSKTVDGQKGLLQTQDYLVSAYGWNVRDLNRKRQKDLHNIANIQAEAFHATFPVFNDFFYDIFKAEVLSGLMYKVRLSPPGRYTCLVAETDDDKKIVGVVDLTAMGDKDVTKQLHGADEYFYVSGLAVDANYRRKNVATALLQGVDLRASEWGFKYLVLHAYEDDVRARKAYSKAGYKVIALDPAWLTTWIGRKRRVLMAKAVPDSETSKNFSTQLNHESKKDLEISSL